MVLVTGASGMVGSRLVYDLITQDKEVFVLFRNEQAKTRLHDNLKFYTQNPDVVFDRVKWISGDITDMESLLEAIQPGIEVYHCAAMVSFNPARKSDLMFTNVEGTANLVNACLANSAKKLCHVSSIGALGSRIDHQPIDENTPWSADHKSAYSISKYLSELEVWRGIEEGLNAVIVNPAVILGPGDWNSGSPEFFSRTAQGMKFYTNGSTSYVDVRDVTKAMIQLMNSEISARRFVLASETLTYRDLFTRIANALNVEPPKKYASPLLTSLAWRAEKVITLFNGREPRITRHTHRVAHIEDVFDGMLLKKTLSFNYTPIDETIEFVGRCFKS
jgi:nucleoside-diphosphate-sugar epimerase